METGFLYGCVLLSPRKFCFVWRLCFSLGFCVCVCAEDRLILREVWNLRAYGEVFVVSSDVGDVF